MNKKLLLLWVLLFFIVGCSEFEPKPTIRVERTIIKEENGNLLFECDGNVVTIFEDNNLYYECVKG